ncbi:MAG: hypothetical protein ACXW1W_17945 [Methylococcaceae bacterium]
MSPSNNVITKTIGCGRNASGELMIVDAKNQGEQTAVRLLCLLLVLHEHCLAFLKEYWILRSKLRSNRTIVLLLPHPWQTLEEERNYG